LASPAAPFVGTKKWALNCAGCLLETVRMHVLGGALQRHQAPFFNDFAAELKARYIGSALWDRLVDENLGLIETDTLSAEEVRKVLHPGSVLFLRTHLLRYANSAVGTRTAICQAPLALGFAVPVRAAGACKVSGCRCPRRRRRRPTVFSNVTQTMPESRRSLVLCSCGSERSVPFCLARLVGLSLWPLLDIIGALETSAGVP
jgi:hypothetical protein